MSQGRGRKCCMKTKKQRYKEKDFKVAKGLFIFFQFLGCAVAGYFTFQTIIEIKSNYENNQIKRVIIFLVLALFFLYLTIKTGRDGIQALKAKNMKDLPKV
jgi:hypothetical protein